MTLWKIITKSFNDIVDILANKTLKGDETLENLRCAYKTDETNIVHVCSAFEFIDLDLAESAIKEITLYQLFNQN